jgi:hypothetical protein
MGAGAGRVFQRLRVENGLGWMDVTSDDSRICLSGVPSTDGNVFFISHDGRLLERRFEQARSNSGGMWTDHGKPRRGVDIVSILDAHTLLYGSIFCIGNDGKMYELNLETSWEVRIANEVLGQAESSV